jgi:tetratricopeptide (TPR) repeat protein
VGGSRAAKLAPRLRDAARAFERERFVEARKLLKPLVDAAPGSAAVRELLGLTYYRLGRWREAAKELQAFADLTGSTEQHPVLADCARALKRWPEVDRLWEELREASPSAELVAEGRIVVAGALADRGRLAEAIILLSKATRPTRRPREHHLRQAYALADLAERAGDVVRARELFAWVAGVDRDFADAAARAAALA